MNGGYRVDCGALRSAAGGLRKSVTDLQRISNVINGSQCDIPHLAFTEWSPQHSPPAVTSYAQMREYVEAFLSQMVTRLGNLANGLDMVAQDYQRTEAENTAAARSSTAPPTSQERILAGTGAAVGMEAAMPGAGAAALGSLLPPPPGVEHIIRAAEALRRSLSQVPWTIALETAASVMGNTVQKLFEDLEELITKAGQYLEAWVTAQSTVAHVAEQWGNQAGALQDVLTDCQTQVSDVQDYWSGRAADEFSKYATDLLNYLQPAAQAFGAVNSHLNQLADSIGHLNNEIIFTGADLVVNTIQTGADVGDSLVDNLPIDALAPPAGAVKTACDATDKVADAVAKAQVELDNAAKQVLGYLDDIASTSAQMRYDVSQKVPSRLPAEPPGLSAPGNWHPE